MSKHHDTNDGTVARFTSQGPALSELAQKRVGDYAEERKEKWASHCLTFQGARKEFKYRKTVYQSLTAVAPALNKRGRGGQGSVPKRNGGGVRG